MTKARTPRRTPRRTNKMVQALASTGEFAQLRSGIVTAVTKAVTPHQVTVRISEQDVAEITYQAWWDPQVGDVVQLVQQGSSFFCLGPCAPAKLMVAAHEHTISPPTNPAAPPAPPTVPTGPATLIPKSVTAIDSGSWDTKYSRWREDGVYQGGGWTQRGYWFYGTKIATAKGSGTIVAATITVKRSKSPHGVIASGNVRVGTHTHASQPGGAGAVLSNVAKLGSLARGKGGTFALTTAQVAALNAGAVGVGLQAGSLGFESLDYIIAEPRSAGDWSGVLSLTIQP